MARAPLVLCLIYFSVPRSLQAPVSRRVPDRGFLHEVNNIEQYNGPLDYTPGWKKDDGYPKTYPQVEEQDLHRNFKHWWLNQGGAGDGIDMPTLPSSGGGGGGGGDGNISTTPTATPVPEDTGAADTAVTPTPTPAKGGVIGKKWCGGEPMPEPIERNVRKVDAAPFFTEGSDDDPNQQISGSDLMNENAVHDFEYQEQAPNAEESVAEEFPDAQFRSAGEQPIGPGEVPMTAPSAPAPKTPPVDFETPVIEEFPEVEASTQTMPKHDDKCNGKSDSCYRAHLSQSAKDAVVLLHGQKISDTTTLPASVSERSAPDPAPVKSVPLCNNGTNSTSNASALASLENSSPMLKKPRSPKPPVTEEEASAASSAMKKVAKAAPSPQVSPLASPGARAPVAAVASPESSPLSSPSPSPMADEEDIKPPTTDWKNMTHHLDKVDKKLASMNITVVPPPPPVYMLPNEDCIPEIDEDCDQMSRTTLNAVEG